MSPIARLRLTPIDIALWVLLVVLFFLPEIQGAGRPSPPVELFGIAIGVAYTATVLSRKAWPLATSLVVSPLFLIWMTAGYEPHELQSLPAVVVAVVLTKYACEFLAKGFAGIGERQAAS